MDGGCRIQTASQLILKQQELTLTDNAQWYFQQAYDIAMEESTIPDLMRFSLPSMMST
jgi:hypothetical protein